MNKGVLFIICTISSAVWDRTDCICGGSGGVDPSCTVEVDLIGNGIEALATVEVLVDLSNVPVSSKSSGISLTGDILTCGY